MGRCAVIVAAFVGIVGAIGSAQAQVYPSRPITIIVPFAAGGPSDTITRILGEHMRGSLGQPIIVDNVVGAGGTIGVGRAARAKPDGYTAVTGNWGSFVVTGAMYTLPYDLQRDFAPVSLFVTEPLLVCARKALAAKDLRELIEWLKANPDKATMGTSGIDGPSHIAGALFQQMTATRFTLVPYRGAGPAVQDLVAGQLDFGVYGPAAVLPHARAGAIKCYAVTAPKRMTSAVDYPTVDEAGLPGFHLSVWHGVWVPQGTPNDVIAKLNSALVAAVADATVSQRLRDIGQEIWPREQQTPEGLAAYQKAEIEKWWPIIKAAGIRAE